ncbi:MAG TPA: DUF4388 domain-containing protein [Thermoanaerobaculia bacterium]|nr:DUF4388 domain-containing protein [Thermoanaerobaculia bacterium]
MSDELSIQGTLAETTVPDLFRSILRSSETAILSLDAIGRNDTIYFREGRLIFASSTDPDVGLAETLLRTGELNMQQYDTVMDRLVVSRRIGSVLVELGYLKPEELSRAIERQSSAIVINAMRFRTGSYTIDFTTDFPDEIITLPLMTERLVLDGVHAIEFWSLIMRGIGKLDRLLEMARGADTRAYQIELNDEESHVLSLVAESPQTVEKICARSYLTNFATCRTVWGLIVVNMVQDSIGTDLDEKRDAEESEYELEDVVERYNTAFQKIFGIVFQKIGDHIYDFMDRVVLQLSPEVTPYLSGMNFVNEARIDFDQLLNNLIASGSTDRSTVIHNILNELLYGWIYEVRKEFGAAMESEVVRVADALRS